MPIHNKGSVYYSNKIICDCFSNGSDTSKTYENALSALNLICNRSSFTNLLFDRHGQILVIRNMYKPSYISGYKFGTSMKNSNSSLLKLNMTKIIFFVSGGESPTRVMHSLK